MIDQLGNESPGLTSEEARARLVRYGPNRLVARDRAARLRELASLLLDPMAVMLVVAAGVYFALGQRRDAFVMLVALVPVIGVDVFLEARSRTALKRLARGVAPRAQVVRDGQEATTDTADLVPGDLLTFAEGASIQADGIIRAATNLAIDESSLTGESEPRRKRPAPLDASEDVPEDATFYAGSTVLAGQGWGEITATGSKTRFGDLARLVAEVDSGRTPLQRRVGHLVEKLSVVAAAVAIAVFGLGLARGLAWGPALLGGISLAMSAAPEEFPLVFTLFLSVGAWRLTKYGVLVRRIASVETLGSTTVICADKTGTLTEGLFALDQVVAFGDASEHALLEAAVLASEVPPSDPMEKAIRAYTEAHGFDVQALLLGWHLIRDHDFDPIGKHMSHVWQSAEDPTRLRVVAKGALEGVLEHSSIDPMARAALENTHAGLASRGIRVLVVAERRAANRPDGTRASDECDLSVLGLLGFRDPMRAEVPHAVRECQAAGIRIKVVTGDHALTAHAVAESAGILHRDEAIVTGDQLMGATEDERRRLILDAAILSRITPAQKHLIVEVLQSEGEVVAMTGDGINDAPALRRADIGVSMGQRGTDVARAASDLVLLDDNFASIVAAVREGRKIFLDVQRAFLYLLAFHVPIVGLALLPPILGLPLLLLPVHLVWLELIVHPVSALLFQGDAPPADLMRRPPRAPTAPLLARNAIGRSLVSGSLLTVAVLIVYVLRGSTGTDQARSVALATLILGYQILAAVERAAAGGPLLPRAIRPWIIWTAAGVSLPFVLYVSPIATLMSVRPLAAGEWELALIGATLAVGWRIVLALH